MVISHIIGGLGNQMFQYALGRTLSLDRNESLHLDISGFNRYGLHQGFELSRVFECPVEVASKTEIFDILGWQQLPLIRRILARSSMQVFRRDGFVVEPYFQYWPVINQIPQDSYLFGYWQSERYFQFHADIIRTDFIFKSPFVGGNVKLAEQISSTNAVSLHVRRGDYVKNSKTTLIHGLCSLDYYRAAIQLMVERTQEPYFYIFSDDITWVRDNLKIDLPHCYIDHNNGLDSYNDMHLMSLCRHHIIANSSFSWWGAWLNPNSEKIVIAPRKWFANENNVEDLIPEGWITL